MSFISQFTKMLAWVTTYRRQADCSYRVQERTYPDAAESIPSPRTESNLFISEFPNKMLNEIVIPLHVGTVSSDHVNNYSYTIILVYDAT